MHFAYPNIECKNLRLRQFTYREIMGNQFLIGKCAKLTTRDIDSFQTESTLNSDAIDASASDRPALQCKWLGSGSTHKLVCHFQEDAEAPTVVGWVHATLPSEHPLKWTKAFNTERRILLLAELWWIAICKTLTTALPYKRSTVPSAIPSVETEVSAHHGEECCINKNDAKACERIARWSHFKLWSSSKTLDSLVAWRWKNLVFPHWHWTCWAILNLKEEEKHRTCFGTTFAVWRNHSEQYKVVTYYNRIQPAITIVGYTQRQWIIRINLSKHALNIRTTYEVPRTILFRQPAIFALALPAGVNTFCCLVFRSPSICRVRYQVEKSAISVLVYIILHP